MSSILLVDDEVHFANATQKTLGGFGFDVQVANTCEDAHALIDSHDYDLIQVDLNLRDTDGVLDPSVGIGMVMELRARNVKTPIMVYTVLAGDLYETASFNAGADDFVLKTARTPTLLARIRALLLRTDHILGKPSTTRNLGIGPYTLDRERHLLIADEKQISLNFKEFMIMQTLAIDPRRIVSPTEILDKAWRNDDLDKTPAALAGALNRLRKKFAQNKVEDMIENVKGQGFKLAKNGL
jgi:DNA-binding response OmpR family regulator